MQRKNKALNLIEAKQRVKIEQRINEILNELRKTPKEKQERLWKEYSKLQKKNWN